MTTNYTIDAKGKAIGRIATDVATKLMGKDLPTYEKNVAGDVKVTIVNASQVAVTEKKLEQKIYRAYSGYPGGLKTQTMQQVVEKKGFGEIFRDAVKGMLPNNKLRAIRMKNLTITE
jgi:large subunit ribosomal protein L13